MRRSRKRNLTQREASGRRKRPPQAEREAEIIAVVLAQPHRRWANTPRDDRLGYPLGRLLIAGYISERQHEAGQRWAAIVRRYAALIGLPALTARAAGTAMVAAGLSCVAAPDDKVILALRRDYDDCYAALEQVGRDTRTGRGPLITCRQICVQEMNEAVLWPTRIGSLRCGLNALARTFGLRVSSSESP